MSPVPGGAIVGQAGLAAGVVLAGIRPWLRDTAFRGRVQYVGATDGEDAERCDGYWLFTASWAGELP